MKSGTSISIEQLHEFSKKLNSGDLILDVRTPQEFADGHVPKSKNIPVDEVETRSRELNGTKNLYIYCRAGRRAAIACAVLNQKGLEILGIDSVYVVDEGGFPDWEDQSFPVQK